MNNNTIEIYLPKFPKPILIDIEDYELVVRNKWSLSPNKRSIRSTAPLNYNGVKSRTLCRLINRTPEDMYTDHKDSNIFNNTRNNLRSCTPAQNQYNTKSRGKYKGIRQNFRKWTASIKFKGREYFLGSFSSEEEAAKAYDKKAKELFGEFAKLNFPEELL